MPKHEQSAAGETTASEGVPGEASTRDVQDGKERRKPRPPEVRYLGFHTTAAGREYTLRVTDGVEARLFVLLIRHEVFASRQARFQDGPDLCYARMQRDLVADPGLRPGPRLVLTTEEIFEYRAIRERRAPGRTRRGSAS